MTTRITCIAAAIAAGSLGIAGCSDQKRESSTERARSGEDRNAGNAGDRAGAQAPGSTSAAPARGAEAPVNQTAKTISGRVVRASDGEIVLREEGQQQDMTLKVDDDTTVIMNGRQAAASTLPEGTHVLASFDESHQKATRIEAQGPPSSTASQSGPPGSPGSSGTDTPATSPSGSGTSNTQQR